MTAWFQSPLVCLLLETRNIGKARQVRSRGAENPVHLVNCLHHSSLSEFPLPLPSKIIVLGIGDDGLDGLTAASRQQIEAAQLLIGPPPVLRRLPASKAERFEVAGDLDAVIKKL